MTGPRIIDPNDCNATVIVSHGRRCVVRPDDDVRHLDSAIRGKSGRPVCGDRVHLGEGVIEGVGERRNFFPRADRQGRQQIVAANLDRIVVVVASTPEPTRDLINRYLVACEAIGIDAVLCLNKCDLLDEEQESAWRERLAIYAELDYPVLRTEAKSGCGLDALQSALASGVSILVGQSGVGKSSLVNALVPDLALKTQAISHATGKGRHTTTATTLYDMSDQAGIIDSPGVWEYGIWHMEADQVAWGFRDFRSHLGQCRFANCSHVHEPGCALVGAVEAGTLASERLDAYRRIVRAMRAPG